MKVLIILAVCVAAVTQAALIDNSMMEERSLELFTQFKEKFNKVYETVEEELKRMEIFYGNWREIEKHNSKFMTGKESFSMALNEFADLTNEEFVRVYNGYKYDPSKAREPSSIFEAPNELELPTSVDWRTKGYVTPVKNQGQCGSCWAFSTTGSLEGQHFKKNSKLVSLSEQNLVDCSKPEGNDGCEGGLMDQAFKYIKMNKGIDTEQSYPYTGTDGTCHYSTNNIGATDTGFVDIPSKNESALTAAIASVGPISVAIDASSLGFQFYHSGVYYGWFCSETNLDHGVLAVGYGTLNGKDYYIVKNSWASSWGMKGYILMSRNRNNNCGIATQASYPLV